MDPLYAKLFFEQLLKEQSEGKLEFLPAIFKGNKILQDYNTFKKWLETLGIIKTF